MTKRRCVICGGHPPLKDAAGNEAYAYPKTEEEARVWQISMGAKDCSLKRIKRECCVCVEHIPDFVSRAKKIATRLNIEERSAQEQKERDEELAYMSRVCPLDAHPPPERPSVSVLLLNGASLPTYCADGKCCADVRHLPAEHGDCKCKDTKKLHPADSNTEIFVQESGFQDTGGKFPDIDGTEVTVLRAPMQEEEELAQLQQEMLAAEEAEQQEDGQGVRRRRNSCLPGCTDVLLLGRGPHPTDVCPCKCDQCTKPSGLPDPEEGPCCQPECCKEAETEYFTQPPCGCECEQQVRRELGRVIRSQGRRIKQLEAILCRQNSMRTCLQRKLDELYCEFGRLDDAQEDGQTQSQLSCPESQRGGPDCASLRAATPPPPPQSEPQRDSTRWSQRSFKRLTRSRGSIHKRKSEEATEPLPRRERVHGFAEQDPASREYTRRPLWVNAADDQTNLGQIRSQVSFRYPEKPALAEKFRKKSTSSLRSNYSSTTVSKINSVYSGTKSNTGSEVSRSNRSHRSNRSNRSHSSRA